MPVFKYKSFEDAEKGLYEFETDDRYYKMVFSLNNTIFKKALLKGLPKGVHKYKKPPRCSTDNPKMADEKGLDSILLEICKTFNTEGVEYVLIGG